MRNRRRETVNGTTFFDEEEEVVTEKGYLLTPDLGESQWCGDGGNSFGWATVELKQKVYSFISSPFFGTIIFFYVTKKETFNR